MKKLCLSLVILVITTLSVNAQIQYGVKGGFNIASFTGSGSGFASAIVGVHIGALASIPIENNFYFQPEFVFSSEGAKITNISLIHHIDYINIPLLVKYKFDKGFSLEAGPQLGILLSSKDIQNQNTVNVTSATKSLDFAFAFGVNYQLPKQDLGFDIRYNAGITNIFSSTTYTIHNSVFQIGAFYFFNTK
jgi:hypothetical protein